MKEKVGRQKLKGKKRKYIHGKLFAFAVINKK